jgi:hypothetical protein
MGGGTDLTKPIPIPVLRAMIRPRPAHRLLFVYDTLMDRAVLAQHAPNPVFVTAARISSRRFIVNRDGLPGITPRRGHAVFGLVYELEDIALTCLSLRLGFPTTVERFGGFVRDLAGTLMVVEFFSPRDQRAGRAPPDVIAPIVASAQQWSFPESYLDELRQWDIDHE